MMAKSCDSRSNKKGKAPSTLELYEMWKKFEESRLYRPIKQGGGINLADRMIYSICVEKYRTKKKNGKMVFDCKKALRNDPLVWKFYKGNPEGLANRLYQISKSYEKHWEDYLKTSSGKISPWRKQDLFGNVEIFNSLCDKIGGLIESGEDFEDHSRKLQQKYHLYPHKKEKHPEKWITIKEVWDWIAEDYKSMTEDERRLLKEARAVQKAREKLGTCIIDLPPNWGPFG